MIFMYVILHSMIFMYVTGTIEFSMFMRIFVWDWHFSCCYISVFILHS